MQSKKNLVVQLIHIFFFGVLLLYVGIKQLSPFWVYYLLFGLGLLAILYFASQMRKENPFWVVWHVLVIGTVLLWVGIQGPRSPSFLYKLLLIIGSAAIGYHSIRLVQNLFPTQ